jgi:hypothetical protein
MDFANRGNRPNAPVSQPIGAPINQQEQPVTSFKPSALKKGLKFDFGKISTIFMLFAVTILAFILVLGLVFFSDGSTESDAIQTDRYQAVFLDSQDGQVYFGKMSVYNEDMYVLTDIYYVRVENSIQPQGTEEAQPNISLAKLGNELHGPQDVMYISRDKVLYWENLTDEGQVVTAITEFKANGNSTPAATQTQPAQSSNGTGTQPIGTNQVNDTPAESTNPNLLP